MMNKLVIKRWKVLNIMSHTRTKGINSCPEDKQKKQVSDGTDRAEAALFTFPVPVLARATASRDDTWIQHDTISRYLTCGAFSSYGKI